MRLLDTLLDLHDWFTGGFFPFLSSWPGPSTVLVNKVYWFVLIHLCSALMGSQGLELRNRHNKWITLAPDISRKKSNKAISSWNVRTMCLGLSSDLQQIDDS